MNTSAAGSTAVTPKRNAVANANKTLDTAAARIAIGQSVRPPAPSRYGPSGPLTMRGDLVRIRAVAATIR